MAHGQVDGCKESCIMLGREIDLLRMYPRASRNLDERLASKTEEIREIARRFDRDFFDGDRKHGYGGFSYNPKYWELVIPDFVKHFGPLDGKSILDVGCAKGFMLYDIKRLIPSAEVTGIDISKYAIENSMPEVRSSLVVGNANSLPFASNAFDLVISINTVHNLELKECKEAIQEISRVSKGAAFLTVDAFSTEEERERMMAWNLTAKTILSVDDWKTLFQEIGYEGDFFWFIP
jgi:SAM-dependent methyltransferase